MVDRKLSRDCNRVVSSSKSILDSIAAFDRILERISERREDFFNVVFSRASNEDLPTILDDYNKRVLDKERALLAIYYKNIGDMRSILDFFNDPEKRDVLKSGLFKLDFLPEKDITTFLDNLMFSIEVLNRLFAKNSAFDHYFSSLYHLVDLQEKRLLSADNRFVLEEQVNILRDNYAALNARFAEMVKAVLPSGDLSALGSLYNVPKAAFDRIKKPFDERARLQKAKGKRVEAAGTFACLLVGSSFLYGVYALLQPVIELVKSAS